MRQFPEDFLFGTETSAYQIEGAAADDGRSPSIWDTYAGTPGNTYRNQTGEIACDHYHRVDEDIALMQEIGLKAYRFSVSWPRIYPKKGQVNQKGVAFYRSLVDKLLAAGIKPLVTLYHWDLPQWAHELGGWLNRDVVDWYLEFAETMFAALGDAVPYWLTHNEPFCITILGYMKGLHAPGHTDVKEALVAAHHLNVSHGLAVRKFREMAGKDSSMTGKIGITLNISRSFPLNEGAENEELARRADGFIGHWFLQPIFRGTYPDYMVALYEQKIGPLDFIREGDAEIMREPIDYLGVNYYKRHIVVRDEKGLFGYRGVPDPEPRSQEEWQEYPDILLQILRMIREEYADIPMIVTENGLGLESEPGQVEDSEQFGSYITVEDAVDQLSADGYDHDSTRIAYLHKHIRQCHAFLEEGGKLAGYFVWSLMDNFEWALGYSMRFGLVHVDYSTLKRTIKDSGYWYRQVIEHGGLDFTWR